ncbi:unnamed protein product [Cuscuta campestris]|uniref:Uncharacterized protein n=1 Tax=Cuscuta campestris TaxID=132261 RepID=A0A484NGE9_9ASTE|nr:unnamed protein product [Cuscuta campestris]
MDTTAAKLNGLGNILVRILSFAVLVFLARFAYVITTTCSTYDSRDAIRTAGVVRLRDFYSSLFQDLVAEGILYLDSKILCIGTLTDEVVATLRDLGVADSTGIAAKPSVRYGRASRIPFEDESFDFVFSGGMDLERTARPIEIANEISRTLKPGGFFVVLTSGTDPYSLNSLLALFNSYRVIRTSEIDGIDFPSQTIREVVLMKDDNPLLPDDDPIKFKRRKSSSKCPVPGFMHELVRNAEPLVQEEPLKPWIILRRNSRNMTYLPSMADISFKNRYIYIDVGSKNYRSSIGSWFKKHYPKQNKPFQIYAIESDSSFHDEYKSKKGVKLLPYAAWIRNETLFFEITRDPSRRREEPRGRVQTVQSSLEFLGERDKRIQGFDFAEWLESLGLERTDYVVMKMDVEGTEFHLIRRMIERGVMCLVDELFLECHYRRRGRRRRRRTSKYEKSYDQCLELFSSLRQSGVLVHQWW